MNTYTSEKTISDSKEESIAKAINLIKSGSEVEKPILRPNISLAKILLSAVLWSFGTAFFLFACFFFGNRYQVPAYIVHPIVAIGCLAVVVWNAKAMVRNVVLLYQKYAPDRIRRSCLFVPTCSEYMLLAIDKYGVIVGTGKGIRRLLRCHPPNGGEDYP